MFDNNTFTEFEIQTWLPDFILEINSSRVFCAWPVCAEVIYYLRKNKVVYSLSIDTHLNWECTQITLQKIGNKTIKYPGSYFTVVELSSFDLSEVNTTRSYI